MKVEDIIITRTHAVKGITCSYCKRLFCIHELNATYDGAPLNEKVSYWDASIPKDEFDYPKYYCPFCGKELKR